MVLAISSVVAVVCLSLVGLAAPASLLPEPPNVYRLAAELQEMIKSKRGSE